jgi:hypothetical protein
LGNRGRLTVSAWIEPDAAPAEAAWRSVVRRFDEDGGYGLLLGADGAARFLVRDADGGEHAVDAAPGTVPPRRWTHLVGTADAATGRLRLYADGAPAGAVDGRPFVPADGAADLSIGRSPRPEEADGFRGRIDEVTLHERVLDPGEAWRLWAVGLPTLYAQTRETIDAERRVWTRFKGNRPVPHPIEPDTRFSVRFDGSLASDQGAAPLGAAPDPATAIVPGRFGGALDAAQPALAYPSPLAGDRGTVEAWFVPRAGEGAGTLFRAEGGDAWLELARRDGRWTAALGAGDTVHAAIGSPPQPLLDGVPLHLGLAWGEGGDGGRDLALSLNGVEVARAGIGDAASRFDGRLLLGGGAPGALDDLRLSDGVRGWGELCPRGHVETEVAALDLMDACARAAGEPLALWRPGTAGAGWRYAERDWEDDGTVTGNAPEARRSLRQGTGDGFHPIVHPDAFGRMSSIEAGVAFDAVADGWAGVFVRSPSGPGAAFSGAGFALNPATNQLRLAVHRDGAVLAAKTLPYDFRLAARKTYTLTLTALDDGVLRGYLDGHNVISLATDGQAVPAEGYAGLFTEETAAHFADVHFSALTPATAESRLIEPRVFAGGQGGGATVGYRSLAPTAFRWRKRHGLLPWQRTTKAPEAPGNIFGADDGVPRPNGPAPWRSEDSANSAPVALDGTVHLFMRGNPDVAGPHGPAALGVLAVPAAAFDGLHFADPNAGVADLDRAELLRGNPDPAPREMREPFPRDERFQLNPPSVAYVDGRLLVVTREFRNTVPPYPWYRRLAFGLYDPASGTWQRREARHVDWSRMDPADPDATFAGIDATTELVSLRDPVTDRYALFLYHHPLDEAGLFEGMVTGLALAGDDLVLDPAYPTRTAYAGVDFDTVYGERILFDNGIYYLHYNAGSDPFKMSDDWPDRFALAAALHPYAPFVNSAANADPLRPYFARGEELDHDNAAIWHGAMLKHRGRYYLYYENYHAVGNVDRPYEGYDAVAIGSRVGFATAN